MLYQVTQNNCKKIINKTTIMTHEQIREKMELIGLTVNGKAISFAKFKSIADAHQYGSRSNKIYIVYYGHPRQNLFGFYPPQTTKKESLEIAYQYLLSAIEDPNMSEFTYGDIAWGDSGYPISYRIL
jgi:hypothetical protein